MLPMCVSWSGARSVGAVNSRRSRRGIRVPRGPKSAAKGRETAGVTGWTTAGVLEASSKPTMLLQF